MHRSPYHLLNVVRTPKYSQAMFQRRLHASYNHARGMHRAVHLHQNRRKCPVCGRVMVLRRVNRTTMLLNCRHCHFKVNLRKRGRQLVSLPRTKTKIYSSQLVILQ